MAKKKITFELEEDTIKYIEGIAIINEMSPSDIVEDAIQLHFGHRNDYYVPTKEEREKLKEYLKNKESN